MRKNNKSILINKVLKELNDAGVDIRLAERRLSQGCGIVGSRRSKLVIYTHK